MYKLYFLNLLKTTTKLSSPVLEIRKKSSLSLWQMPDNLAPDFGCPDEDLVVLNIWRLKGQNGCQTQIFSRQIAKSNRAHSKVFKIISRNLFQKKD